MSWLQQKAGVEISSMLSIGNSTYGRSFSKEIIFTQLACFFIFLTCILLKFYFLAIWKYILCSSFITECQFHKMAVFQLQIIVCIKMHTSWGLYFEGSLQCCKFLIDFYKYCGLYLSLLPSINKDILACKLCSKWLQIDSLQKLSRFLFMMLEIYHDLLQFF